MKLTRLMVVAIAATLLGGSHAMATQTSGSSQKDVHALRQSPAKSSKPTTAPRLSASPVAFVVGRGAVWLPKGKR